MRKRFSNCIVLAGNSVDYNCSIYVTLSKKASITQGQVNNEALIHAIHKILNLYDTLFEMPTLT